MFTIITMVTKIGKLVEGLLTFDLQYWFHFKSLILKNLKFFAKLKCSPVLFEKIPLFVCLVFKNENE